MGIQALLTVKETVALLAFQGNGTVMLIRIDVVLAAFLHAAPAKVGLIIRAGMVSQIVVGVQAVRTKVTFSEQTLQASQGVIMFILV